MAHSPPTDPNTPRPLPRSASRPTPRANRPRFGLLDAVWAAALCGVSLAVSAWLGELSGRHLLGSLAAAGTVAVVYVLGWRVRDRAAGVGAGLLLALSPQFLLLAADSPQGAAFALLSVGALLAFVAGLPLAGLLLASSAAMVRTDGLLLGLLLLTLALAQKRPRALLGIALFLVPLVAFEAARFFLGHGLPLLPQFGLHGAIWRWFWTPAPALLVWLLVLLPAEGAEPARRARWLPVVLWTALSLLTASVSSVTTLEGTLLSLVPLLCLLAGGGLSRLLPTLAGEFPRPAVRYTLAVLAVLGLAGLHLRLELLGTHLVSVPVLSRDAQETKK